MDRQPIRNRMGQTLGYLDDEGTSIIARNIMGQRLATYDKRMNETRDKLGRRIASGNVLSSFIYNEE